MSKSVAFVFPGQGSQALGMLAEQAKQHRLIEDIFAEASSVLGYDLWELSQEGPKEVLDRTDRTQPVILTASIALWRLWQAEGGVQPIAVAGHSLGEYSALVAAQSLEFERAVQLVSLRGQLMQEAVSEGQGAMAAIIGLADDEVIAACQQAAEAEVVSAANFNAPGQVVIAGNAGAVERAMVLCKDKGAKRALPLPVSVPSHCALMKPAAERFAAALETTDWQLPNTTLVQNVSAEPVTDLAALKSNLIAQLYSPVRWVESVQRLQQLGATDLVEAGPGKVLTGLDKRCVKDVEHHSLETPELFAQAQAALT